MRKVWLATILLALVGVVCPPYFFGAMENRSGRHPSATSGHFQLTSTAADALAKIRGTAGFWRLGQDRSGVWWFVSPDGRLEFLSNVTTVQPVQNSHERGGPHFVSRDWKGNADGEGSQAELESWAAATLQRVRDTGFKGLGAWCNSEFHRLNVPMSQDLNLWTWIGDGSKRFYSADWPELAEQAVRAQVTPLRDNKNLIGYFIDNELDWGDGFAGPGAYFDHLSSDDPNRAQVVKVIRTLWPTLIEFNQAWGSGLVDWKQLDRWAALPREPEGTYRKLGTAWLSHLAEDYFRFTTSLIRRYDPNHLILGVRFKGDAPQEVVAASRDYTDAQSLNYYVGDAKLDGDMFRMMYQSSGQPIVISEYSFHSLDGRSGNADTVGFAAQVPDQRARAQGYRLMTTRLARVPYIVGADWFQWCDEPPGGRGSDGEDVNFGVVSINDQTYDPLADAIRQTVPTLNSLHGGSAVDPQEDVWRDSYAIKPVIQAPFLTHPPVLDGDLSDWPANARVQGMRRDQTVGLERYQVGTPQVYLGWTHEGLYLGIEVFDSRLVTAPATGWWWTRDHVEFWISTRPVSSDQASYDVNCHQFFLVPVNFSDNKGVGVVGQWHRDGDALKDNLIPDPEIKQAVRIFPDRYVAELFIPAKALHGFDPSHQPALAFNLHVLDFQNACDFFWSAPKSMQTQLRPGTWGTLYLNPPPHLPAVARTAAAPLN
ncbi:MAG: hypothetical protein ABR964_08775 [Tepidisphaeraceae bacterium]|jgi:hypothetical protein